MIVDIVHRKEVTAACGCTSCVNLKEPRYHVIFENRLIYFCSRSCIVEFEEDPASFLESDHFKIEFDMLDKTTERQRENVSKEEIEEIKQHRAQLEEDDMLIFVSQND